MVGCDKNTAYINSTLSVSMVVNFYLPYQFGEIKIFIIVAQYKPT